MPLTNDELNYIETAAYLCDGSDGRPFFEKVVPSLSSLSEGELWALAGKFLDRCMLDPARFIAAYARAVGTLAIAEAQARGQHCADTVDGPRPDPGQFLDEWEADEAAYAAIRDEDIPF